MAAKKTSTKTVKTRVATPAPVAQVVPAQAGLSSWGIKDKIIAVQVVLLVLLAFAVGLLYGQVGVYKAGGSVAQGNNALAPEAVPEEITQLSEAQWEKLTDDAEFVKGDDDASVTLVEFTDYQCPFCGQYFTNTYGQLMQDYVDTGKVRYIVRDLPLSFHVNAAPAALAARCAGDQDKYFEMHDALFEAQASWSDVADPKDQFVGLAQEAGLNVNNFTSCYDSKQHQAAVDADLALATEMGASGTPTFFVNGTKLVGAQPYASFQSMIDAAL